jgi:hypothetical protein
MLVAHRQDSVRIVDVASGRVDNAVADPGMLVMDVLWLGDAREFLLAGLVGNEEHVTRWDSAGRAVSVWASSAEFITRLRSFDGGAWIYMVTKATRQNFWQVELDRR